MESRKMRYLTTEIIRVLIFAVRSVVLAASCTTQCERISSLYSTCLITSTLHAAAKLRRHAPCCGAARRGIHARSLNEA